MTFHQVRILPIPVREFTLAELKEGVTTKRHAELFIHPAGAFFPYTMQPPLEMFEVPAEGGTFKLKQPLPTNVRIQARLRIYYQQGEHYFTVSGEIEPQKIKDGELSFKFVERGDTFILVDPIWPIGY